MKKVFSFVLFSCLLCQAEKSFTQSFSVSSPDTIRYCAPNAGHDTACDGNSITNLTASPLDIDVLRIQDDTATPGWISMFCLSACYPPFIDSVRKTLLPNQTIPLMVHFTVSGTPDSGTVVMKIKLAASSAGAVTQRFYCVTKVGLGIHEPLTYGADVNIYPAPVHSGDPFNINISNVRSQSKEMRLVVYNIYGSVVKTINDLKQENNTMNLDLASGIYSYSLISGGARIHSGKISIVK